LQPRLFCFRTSCPFLFLLLLCACREEVSAPTFFFAREVKKASATFDSLQFRSTRKDGGLTTRVSMDGVETREALVPPVPSRLAFPIVVPHEPLLTLAYGVFTFDGKALPAPIEFRLAIDTGEGTETLLLDETVRRRFGNQWFESKIDLSRWAGKRAEVVFETRYRETEFTAVEASGQGVLAAWSSPVLLDRARAASRPDLVLISIDCLRADHVGTYGYDRDTTPNLDALARDGVVFEDAASVSSWTLPTHMSMLTGVLPTQHGLRRDQKRLPSVPYLPELLGRSGYETIGIVSSLLLTPTFGYDQGFDRYHALVDVPAPALVDTAIREMTGRDRGSRFLFLHLFDAHWPYSPSPELLTRFGRRPKDISELLKKVIDRRPPSTPEDIEGLKSLYDAEIYAIDRELGRLFDALKQAGRYDGALIIVTADHGEAFYEHGLWQHAEVIYNEVTHVPLIVKWPGSQRRGRETRVVDQLHLFPTILEAASLPSPHARKSLSTAEEVSPITEITWEGREGSGRAMKVAVRRGPLKYVATFKGEKGARDFVSERMKEELYDLAQDPGETKDILGGTDAGAFRSRVRAFLEEVRSRRGAGEAADAIVLDEETRDRLRALGYLDP
jgi:arylsulfatase A-like enzyme